MKKKILTFFMTLLILITNLSTPVFGFNSYEEYYNTTYLYSLKIPKDIKNVVMDSNLSVVTIPYEDQIRLEIHVEKVEDLIGEDVIEKNNIKDPDKINIKSDIVENTYGNDSYMQQNAVNIAKKFTSTPTVTKVENCKIDRRNGYKIYYNSELTGADGEALTGHGMIMFTIDHGDVYYFVFTDNSLREENIDDYDFFDKAINSINLEDFDYTPFILIGILCAILYVLLMTLYLKAERRAEQRKERKRREKELKKKRALGLEPISHDDDYEYYDEIVIEEADEDEEVDGESVFTVEQIMKLYPSLKDIKIVPKENGTADIVSNGELNGNIIDYKEIEKDLDNKIKSSKEEDKKEESENVNIGNVAAMTKIKDESEFYEFENENDVKEEIGFELVNNSENHVSKATLIDQDYDNDEESFVFEDVDEELYEAKRDKNLNLTFEQPSNKESVNVEEFGEDIENFKDENTSISEEEIFEDVFDNSDEGSEDTGNSDEVILDNVSKEEIESIYDEVYKENEFEETIKEITEETDDDVTDIKEEDGLSDINENKEADNLDLNDKEDISEEVNKESKDVSDEDLEETEEIDVTKEDMPIDEEETSDDVKHDDKDFHLENEDNKEASYEEESSSIDEQDDEKLNTDNAEVLDESENVQHDTLEETSDEQLEENKETEIVEEIESEESNEEVSKENDKEQEDLKDDIEETKEENEDVETQKNEALDDEVSSEEVVNTSDEETSDVEELDENIHENEVFDEVSNEEIESTNEVEQLEEEKQQVIDDKENDISDSEESSNDETSREINEVEEEEISSTDNMDSSLEEYTEDEQSENEADSNNIEDITESSEEKEDIDDIDISNDEDNEKSDNEEDAISKSDKKEK